MPFTLSHAAAVLPLLQRGRGRGRLIGSALVFGAMAPDVPYFAGAFAWGDRAHAWWAVPTLDVAISAALAGVWHLVLRAPLTALLPARWAGAAQRLTRSHGPRIPWPKAPWFALSAAIGATTHVFLDGFTHPGRFGTRLLPALETTRILGEPLYAVLQYGLSVLGLMVLGWSVLRELRRSAQAGGRPEVVASPATRRLVLGLTLLAAVLGAAYRMAEWNRPGLPLLSLIPVIAFGAVTGVAGALVLYSLVASRQRG
ncbi:DUF4184 family protein [Kitasatospora azatica]|uniref:DUF4184 family protein n=1 Tax=Kitasatospora azatica TaxID=58347 RepID=UPI000A009693|nr:DUF4184 family protein [Kitasatospora azatica]